MAPSRSRCSLWSINLYKCLFLISNICTGVIVFIGFYFSTHYSNTVLTADKVGRQLLVDSNQPILALREEIKAPPSTSTSIPTLPLTTPTVSNPPPTQVMKIISSTMVYHFFSRMEAFPVNSVKDQHINMFCKLQDSNALAQTKKPAPHSNHTSSNHTPSNSSSSNTPSNHTHVRSNPNHIILRNTSSVKSTSDSHKDPSSSLVNTSTTPASQSNYIPYVIGITPTYYRMTQKLDLTSLCQTLMNVPRFLWIVVEDSDSASSQVKNILSYCRIESVLLHVKTTNDTKKAKQRGVDQRNLAMDWLRDRCKACDGQGTCEGVLYFMDDDNTFDIRLFEKIRWTRGVSVFPVGFVAGLKFEGPVCKDGKVESWQVQYAPKRHIPVDMAAFALNVKMLTNKPNVRMGFKPGNVKRSTPGYLEPDFLKSLGAKRETVECRGSRDEVLVWHVKSTYKSLVYEKKHPSDPKVKV